MGIFDFLFGSNKNKKVWKELDFHKVPRWVKKAVSNSMPSPVSRPPNFYLIFKGRHFIYKFTYEEKSYEKTYLRYFRKRR